jgi:hypothetical protein
VTSPAGSGRHVVPAVLAALTTMAVGIASIGFVLIPTRPGVENPGAPVTIALMATFVLVTPVLGALIAIRRPDNPIGWLFIAVVFFFVLSFLGDGIARHLQPTTAVGGFAVVTNAIGYFAFGTLFVIFEIFPTGHALPGWRWLPVAAIAGTTAQAATGLFGPLSLQPPVPDLENPFALPGWQSALDALSLASGLLLIVVVVGTLMALILRFRRARGGERQQIKWFAWSAMLTASLLGASLLTAPWQPVTDALWTLALSSLVLLPVASTAAILRYRLWDIDRIISRTLSYAIVSGLLAAVFAGLVLGLQDVLASVTGASTLAVAASTLAVFALFAPLRRRVQRVVDRRFNRSRYNAEHTVAELTARLRDETDLALVRSEVEAAIHQALAPSSTVVWMRSR